MREFAWLLPALGFGLAVGVGCFDDPQTGECSDGAAGCACFANGTCNEGLECEGNLCGMGNGETGDGDGDPSGDGDGDVTGDGDGDVTGDGDGDVTGDGDGDVTGDGDGDPGSPELFPVPPDSDVFEWQSSQVRFEDDRGDTCLGNITMAVSDKVFCYAGDDGDMHCAGQLFNTIYGATFQATGLMDVQQISLRPAFNGPTGNGGCILRNERVYCMGANNNSGQYGTGGTSDVQDWTQWGNVSGVVGLATGTGDSYCALREDGEVLCAGSGFGNAPVVSGSNAERLYVNTFGEVVTDDADVWRVSEVRATCQLVTSGLRCDNQSYGPAGEIVQGGQLASGGVCFLTIDKSVRCINHFKNDYFTPGRVLALATGSVYTDSMCAAYDDGSIWCVGSNDEGKFGTGNNLDLDVETEVAPPGSIRIGCD